jgi:hypothetical protein
MLDALVDILASLFKVLVGIMLLLAAVSWRLGIHIAGLDLVAEAMVLSLLAKGLLLMLDTLVDILTGLLEVLVALADLA